MHATGLGGVWTRVLTRHQAPPAQKRSVLIGPWRLCEQKATPPPEATPLTFTCPCWRVKRTWFLLLLSLLFEMEVRTGWRSASDERLPSGRMGGAGFRNRK